MRKTEYFCGWYFKCQSEKESIAFIPAVHIGNGQQRGSIQFISNNESWNFSLPYEQCQVNKDRPFSKLGENIFSKDGIHLNLHTKSLSATGSVRFGPPSSLRFDIMGPFCSVPFMECRHRVFSMRHTVNGTLQINGKSHCFENSVGYIEGDRGRSFPQKYIWTQCCFDGGSLMLSVAEIPIGPIHFTGIIGIVQLHGKEYRLATYLGAKVLHLKNREIVIQQGNFIMTAILLDEHANPLKAPRNGVMTRTIRENIVCRAQYQLREQTRILLDLESETASFEYEY